LNSTDFIEVSFCKGTKTLAFGFLRFMNVCFLAHVVACAWHWLTTFPSLSDVGVPEFGTFAPQNDGWTQVRNLLLLPGGHWERCDVMLVPGGGNGGSPSPF